MKWTVLVAVGLVAFAVEARWVPAIEIRGVVPQLMLALVLYLALVNPPARVFAPAWCLGLARDLLPGYYFGLYALSFMLAGAGLAWARKALFQEHPVTRLAVFFAGGLAGGFLDLANAGGAVREGLMTVLGTAVYTALVATPLSYVLDRRDDLFKL